MTDAPLSAHAPPRFAVVLKTHAWDPFVARQVARYVAALGRGDLFVCLDETSRPAGPVPHPNVIRFTNSDLLALGLADRWERGSLLWWNTDYPNYLFLERHPEYDYYLFVEYDTFINRDLAGFVDAAAARGADLVALPTRGDLRRWMWTKYHQQVYPLPVIRGSLNCISLWSRRALGHLMARRRAMSAERRVAFWPGNEVFVATEINRAGFRFLSLAEFGNADGYEWYPPHLEQDLPTLGELTFLHPVLDQERYLGSLLRFSSMPAYFFGRSRLRQAVGRFPEERYWRRLPGAFWRRAVFRARERAQAAAMDTRLRLGGGRGAPAARDPA